MHSFEVAAVAVKVLQPIGWVLVIVLVALTFLASVLQRSIEVVPALTGDFVVADTASFDGRYLRWSWLTLAHTVSGGLFLLIGPFQFVRRLRQRRLAVHRAMGRTFVVASLAAAFVGIAIAVIFPAWGGLSARLGFLTTGVLLVTAVTIAFVHIRAKRVALHREWMIRAFAMGLVVGTFRLGQSVMMIAGLGFDETWEVAAWLGIVVNGIAAELWINLTRAAAPAAPPAPAVAAAAPAANG